MIGIRSALNQTVTGLALLVAMALFSGCASQRIETLSQKMADQQRQIGTLQREDIEMKSRIEEQRTGYYLMEKRLKENNYRMGDIQARLQSLEISLGEIKGSLEGMKAPLEKPLATAAAPPSAAPAEISPAAVAPLASEVAPSAPVSQPEPPQKVQPAPAGALGSQELYNRAMRFLKAGEMGQAILEFERYTQEFPQSELTDNAQYWIGEAYYSQKEFKRALAEFQKVPDRFPQGDKVPDALLKVGLSYLELGQREKAIAEWKKLLAKYPDSAPASLARKKLAELSKSK